MINIVLYQPQIPFNTANIIRTCVATNSKLHLIKPLGFDLSKEHKDLKRGSTNFINEVDLTIYENFEQFEKEIDTNKLFILTRYGDQIYSQIEYGSEQSDDVYIMFGSESTGVEEQILQKYQKQTFRIPMSKKMRSLNLSNCVALITYDLLKNENFEGLEFKEPHKTMEGNK